MLHESMHHREMNHSPRFLAPGGGGLPRLIKAPALAAGAKGSSCSRRPDDATTNDPRCC